jgi:hypothetical protein
VIDVFEKKTTTSTTERGAGRHTHIAQRGGSHTKYSDEKMFICPLSLTLFLPIISHCEQGSPSLSDNSATSTSLQGRRHVPTCVCCLIEEKREREREMGGWMNLVGWVLNVECEEKRIYYEKK